MRDPRMRAVIQPKTGYTDYCRRCPNRTANGRKVCIACLGRFLPPLPAREGVGRLPGRDLHNQRTLTGG